MKSSKTLFSALVIAAALACTTAFAAGQVRQLLVEGMTCSHCVSSVTEELSAIDGVEGVSVDLNAGGASRVTIRSSTAIPAAAVEAAVEEAGYAVATSPS